MSSPAVIDFITKETVINKNIVTYRSLSRQLSLHISVAKEELALFHANAKSDLEHVFATFLLSGEIAMNNLSQSTDQSMDVDDTEDIDDGDEVPMMKMVLVGEQELEATKATFQRVISCHVYCLSPSALRDAGLISGPSEQVQKADYVKGAEYASSLGKVISPDVKLSSKASKNKPSISSTFLKPPPITPSGSVTQETAKLKTEEKAMNKESSKPKASGTLDWSKAKAKGTKIEASNSKELKLEKDSIVKVEGSPPVLIDKITKKDLDEKKCGTKRKSDVMSRMETDDEQPESRNTSPEPGPSAKPAIKDSVRVMKGAIVSDDEDEEQVVKPSKLKAPIKYKAKTSESDLEAERSLRAMMDIDDDEVMRVSRPVATSLHKQELKEEVEEEEEKTEDITMEDMEDAAPKPKPRKRKEKKVIPVGRNGLKKKRVMKTRTEEDAKGYMVTEDYSSYESVDEEEPEPEKPQKGPKKNARPSKVATVEDNKSAAQSEDDSKVEVKKFVKKANNDSKRSAAKPNVSRKPSLAGSNNLTNYFSAGGTKR